MKKLLILAFCLTCLTGTFANAKPATPGNSVPPDCIYNYHEPQLKKAWTLYNIGKYKQVLNIVRPLAMKGNAPAQVILGDCYENGLGVGIAPGIAAKWYQIAAEQGYPPAFRKLGYAYNAGNGVQKDFPKAVAMMAEAALRGDTPAIETLRIWEKEGRVIIRDFRTTPVQVQREEVVIVHDYRPGKKDSI